MTRARARRRTAIAIAATMAAAIVAALIVGRLLAPPPRLDGEPVVGAGVVAGEPVVRWLVDVGERVTALDLAAHPPVVVGDRVLVAGSRIGHLALDLGRGAVVWRRPAGPSLAAPLVIDPHDVVLIRDCDVAVAAPPDAAVVACFERIDPLDISDRAAGIVTAPIARAADCAAGGVWQLARAGAGFRLARGACALAVLLPDGTGRSVDAPPPPAPPADPDCDVLADGTTWCQRVADGASIVEIHGARLPGLSVLAAARDGRRAAVVVRTDATLRHDVLVALVDGQPAWRWPLPEPTADRATPIGLSISDAGVLVLFDSSRVAALVAPAVAPL